MKKIIVLLLCIILSSCSLDNDAPNFEVHFMPIESVDAPMEFEFGETYEITVNYTRPSNCYEFQRFIFDSDGQTTRSIAVVDNEYFFDSCDNIPTEASVSFNFQVFQTGTYVFQFYQGRDENQQDQYLVIEIPVAE